MPAGTRMTDDVNHLKIQSHPPNWCYKKRMETSQGKYFTGHSAKIPASLFRITVLTVQTLNLKFLLLFPINTFLTKQFFVFRANKIVA